MSRVGARLKRLDDPRILTGAEAVRFCTPYRGILLHYKGMKTGAMLPLARERVRYVGEPIAVVADLFGLPEHRVRVIAPDVGGSFGIKIHVYQDDMAA